jgi:hypothetical protein
MTYLRMLDTEQESAVNCKDYNDTHFRRFPHGEKLVGTAEGNRGSGIVI